MHIYTFRKKISENCNFFINIYKYLIYLNSDNLHSLYSLTLFYHFSSPPSSLTSHPSSLITYPSSLINPPFPPSPPPPSVLISPTYPLISHPLPLLILPPPSPPSILSILSSLIPFP